jgi:hypothetical protein
LHLWDLTTRKELFKVPGDRGAFSPDGKLFACGGTGEDHAIGLWEVATGKERCRFKGHGSRSCLAFSPDGRVLATGSQDHTVMLWDVAGCGRAEKAPNRRLSDDDLEELWADLANEDPARAHPAIWRLIGEPKQAVALLKERLRPVPDATAERISAWIDDLDNDKFEERQEVAAELEAQAELAEPALRKALDSSPSLEAKRRLEALTAKLENRALAHDWMRTYRALEVLEYVGSPEAKQVLENLATGNSKSRITEEANLALSRLAIRP